jgi:hypothetical protein
LQGQLYLRQVDGEELPPQRQRPFRTKLELAVEQLHWLKPWVESHTFLATWRPAGGVIHVAPVKQEDTWLPFFCIKPEVTPEEILEAMADRNALGQTKKDVKEVWGAGEQQVRNVDSNKGCFNLQWGYTFLPAAGKMVLALTAQPTRAFASAVCKPGLQKWVSRSLERIGTCD